MKNIKLFRSVAVLLIAFCFIIMAACSTNKEPFGTNAETTTAIEGTAYTAETTTLPAKETITTAKADENTIYGKVTAILGTKITVAIGTLKQISRKPQYSPSESGNTGSQTAGNLSERNSIPNETQPSGNQGGYSRNNSAGQQRTPPSGNMLDLLTLTGKSKTITVSGSVIITKLSLMEMFGGNFNRNNVTTTVSSKTSDTSVTISDISVGSMLKITYKTGTDAVALIEIIGLR